MFCSVGRCCVDTVEESIMTWNLILALVGVHLGCGVVAQGLYRYDRYSVLRNIPIEKFDGALLTLCLILGPVMLLVGILINVTDGRFGLMWTWSDTPTERAARKSDRIWAIEARKYGWKIKRPPHWVDKIPLR